MDILKNAENFVLFEDFDSDKQAHVIINETLFSFRLERLVALKQLINIECNYGDTIDKIFSIRDRKGCLTVFWKSVPSEQDCSIIKRCWEVLQESQIEHYYFDKLIKY